MLRVQLGTVGKHRIRGQMGQGKRDNYRRTKGNCPNPKHSNNMKTWFWWCFAKGRKSIEVMNCENLHIIRIDGSWEFPTVNNKHQTTEPTKQKAEKKYFFFKKEKSQNKPEGKKDTLSTGIEDENYFGILFRNHVRKHKAHFFSDLSVTKTRAYDCEFMKKKRLTLAQLWRSSLHLTGPIALRWDRTQGRNMQQSRSSHFVVDRWVGVEGSRAPQFPEGTLPMTMIN